MRTAFIAIVCFFSLLSANAQSDFKFPNAPIAKEKTKFEVANDEYHFLGGKIRALKSQKDSLAAVSNELDLMNTNKEEWRVNLAQRKSLSAEIEELKKPFEKAEAAYNRLKPKAATASGGSLKNLKGCAERHDDASRGDYNTKPSINKNGGSKQ